MPEKKEELSGWGIIVILLSGLLVFGAYAFLPTILEGPRDPIKLSAYKIPDSAHYLSLTRSSREQNFTREEVPGELVRDSKPTALADGISAGVVRRKSDGKVFMCILSTTNVASGKADGTIRWYRLANLNTDKPVCIFAQDAK